MKKNRKSLLLLIATLVMSLSLMAERRDRWQQPQKVMDAIGVKAGMKIGIAGAGRGYFTFKMAPRVGGQGRIYANEIDEDLVEYIKNRCQRENITNVTTILGEVADPLFPRGQMDMVFMCYVFHDLEKPVEFLKNISKSLVHGADVVIMEQDPGKTGSYHFFTQKVLREKVKAAGYRVVNVLTFLKKDNIYVCQPEKYGKNSG